jgi:hypothetical protein
MQSESEAATTTAEMSHSAALESVRLQCAELEDALAHSTSERERSNAQSQQELQLLQEENSAAVTRLERELSALQQQYDAQVCYICYVTINYVEIKHRLHPTVTCHRRSLTPFGPRKYDGFI